MARRTPPIPRISLPLYVICSGKTGRIDCSMREPDPPAGPQTLAALNKLLVVVSLGSTDTARCRSDANVRTGRWSRLTFGNPTTRVLSVYICVYILVRSTSTMYVRSTHPYAALEEDHGVCTYSVLRTARFHLKIAYRHCCRYYIQARTARVRMLMPVHGGRPGEHARVRKQARRGLTHAQQHPEATSHAVNIGPCSG